ncbi:MAG TPA: hypothetical protein VJU86_09205 [Pyrinomonadaceae bacterium]|nr:hypothetical protein [Pyrinomonadaceae bacterium]
MRSRKLNGLLRLCLLTLVVACLSTSAFGQGQGRGGGNGGGRGSGGGAGNAGGPPPGVGVDRGLGNASDRSNGRSDDGLSNASSRSNGRSDAGLERARMASNNLRNADRDLREHPGIAHTLRVNANDLRAGYQSALATNPELKFGHYVAATRLAQNLGSRFPNITRTAILERLAAGDSIGQALQDLGLGSDEAKAAKKRAEREMKEARN